MTREDYESTDTLAWRRCLAECLKARKDGKRSRTASLRLSSVFFYSALALNDTVRAIVTLFFLSRHVWLAVSYIPFCRISPAGGFFKLVWIGLPSPLWCFVLACPWLFFPHRFSAWNCPVIALHPLDFALDFSSFIYLFPSCSFIPHRSPC